MLDIKDLLSSAIKYIEGLEEENKVLKENLEKLIKDSDLGRERLDAEILRVDELMKEYNRLMERTREFQDKYIKECRRVSLLETENNRNMDELKKLKREKKELLKNDTKGREKLSDLIKG